MPYGIIGDLCIGLAPIQHQAIICTKEELLTIGPLKANFSHI